MNKLNNLLLNCPKIKFNTGAAKYTFLSESNNNIFDILNIDDRFNVKCVTIELEQKENKNKPNLFKSISDDDSDDSEIDELSETSSQSEDMPVKVMQENKRICLTCNHEKPESAFIGNVGKRIFAVNKPFKVCYACRLRGQKYATMRRNVMKKLNKDNK
jgi:excinuclease UvrABC ATPase subunit